MAGAAADRWRATAAAGRWDTVEAVHLFVRTSGSTDPFRPSATLARTAHRANALVGPGTSEPWFAGPARAAAHTGERLDRRGLPLRDAEHARPARAGTSPGGAGSAAGCATSGDAAERSHAHPATEPASVARTPTRADAPTERTPEHLS
ncbi:hypothetical protein, partial [Nocardiopsis sp. JB363]|uniref:hypothetical protein n=1 Tax=Nocardiopsis sp. JB363 TaxID=1434837 RepID=UPI001F445B35